MEDLEARGQSSYQNQSPIFSGSMNDSSGSMTWFNFKDPTGDLVKQFGIFLGLPRFLFAPKGTDRISELTSKAPVLNIMPTECLQNLS